MTTLREVARHAGVSTKTASNAINGYARVSPRLRHRVLAAVEELGYRPNQIARALRGGRGDLLTLVVPAGGDERVITLARKLIMAAESVGCEIVTDHRDATDRSCLLILATEPELSRPSPTPTRRTA
ncbi:LacI family DNA-binding transcriptional regulator [Microlunatus sp. GCM10028923]|uniref:LacI family DNA-binding transcriptional regulator n=1 Tax=Microlunatus sp. GCM10028923 TaxID=3273400 RepID=UPI0036201560